MKKRPHWLTVLNVSHHNQANEKIWEAKNLENILHLDGELFALSLLYDSDYSNSKHVLDGDDNPTRPDNYYLGLDNRSTVSSSDTMISLSSLEPTSNGYARQIISSTTGFTIELDVTKYRVRTNVISFTASGGSFGPIRNVFLSNKIGNDGFLMNTVSLGTQRTVASGETLTFELSLSLSNCS